MTIDLRSAAKKYQIKNDISSKLSSNPNSKAIKRRVSKTVKAKDQDNQSSDVWNINSILSNIFAYTDHKDLVKFNTVSKKWNDLTNPIIRKSIKLQRSSDIKNKVHNKRLDKDAETNAEAKECIASNAKFAHFFKEFKFCEKLEPQLAISFFETFRYITNLTIERVTISQDQFLGMINPLIQLKELNLTCFSVKKIYGNKLYTKVIQLPPTLTKLSIEDVCLIDNPELFVQTINSHTNLVEFVNRTNSHNVFLTQFQKNYPSLKSFEFYNRNYENPQYLVNIIELNPQLVALKLELSCWSNLLISSISKSLTNLEEFSLSEVPSNSRDRSTLIAKFCQLTKIKKLNLRWTRLSQWSLHSILSNCPDLEELTLSRTHNYTSYDSEISLNFNNLAKIKRLIIQVQKLSILSLDSILLNCSDLEELTLNCTYSYMSYGSEIPFNVAKLTKIKKLIIICEKLSVLSLDSILLNCPQLKDLEIGLPGNWKEYIKVVGSRCISLEKLTISPFLQTYGQANEDFYKELYEQEFLTTNSNYKSTLTSLTLIESNFNNSKAKYFEKFQKLKQIKYPAQSYSYLNNPDQGFKIDKDLWPNYKLNTKEEGYFTDVELVKLYI